MRTDDRALLAEADLLAEAAWSDDELFTAELTGAADAAVALGLLAPRRRDELLALSTEAGERRALAVDAAGRATLLAELEHLLTRLGDARANERFEGVLMALRAARALTEEDVLAWEERAEQLDADEDEERAPQADPRPPDERFMVGLQAVLPGPTAWSAGARVVAIVCGTGGLDVRWELEWTVMPPDQDFDAWDRFAQVVDDVGTPYWIQGGTRGGEPLVRGRWRVEPGVPASARTLTVVLGDARFAFDVTGVGARPAV